MDNGSRLTQVPVSHGLTTASAATTDAGVLTMPSRRAEPLTCSLPWRSYLMPRCSAMSSSHPVIWHHRCRRRDW
jgi:hypothetical protein